ncbi:MAG: DNRLRE domain-containing protein [Anaerolineae bacterium]|nr:DNRLRE domain-containing protein [Anaerolineae bacterium]
MSGRRWFHLALAVGVFAACAGLLFLLNLPSSAAGPASPHAAPTPIYTRVYRQGLNGYAGAADVTIQRAFPDTNFEGQTYLRLHCNDHTRLPEQAGVLIRFDLSDLPRNARVLSATFQLVTFSRNITDDLLVSFHVLSRTWEAGQVTWNRPRVGEAWATPGANDIWYDRREEWESWALFRLTNPPQARYSWDVTQAVQYWVEQPRWNHGAKLLAYIGQRREVQYDAYSSEAPYPDLRPQLVVTYTLDPAVPTPTDVPPTPTATPTRRPEGPLYRETFQQGLNGYFGVSDTYLYRRAPDIFFSESISLHLRWQDKDETGFVDRDESNPLIHFDLRSISSHALVTSATLYLYAFYQSNSSYLDVTSHRVLRDWDRRLATWREAAPGVPWYAEGCGAPERDFQKRESDWVDMPAAGAWYAFNVRDMVQHWVWYPEQNFGLLLKPHVDVNVGYSFYSSEAPTQTLRPRLVVEYWLPADVPTATPTPAGAASPTPSPTPSVTWTLTPSSTPTPTHSATPSPTPTATSSPTWTASPTATATETPTSTATPSGTPPPTETPSPTATATSTATPLWWAVRLPLVLKGW